MIETRTDLGEMQDVRSVEGIDFWARATKSKQIRKIFIYRLSPRLNARTRQMDLSYTPTRAGQVCVPRKDDYLDKDTWQLNTWLFKVVYFCAHG